MKTDERRLLIDGLLDGDISEADFLRLEAELSVDASARREYYERMALAVLLEVESGEDAAARPIPNRISPTPKSIRRWQWAFATVATTAVVLFAILCQIVTRANESDRGNLSHRQDMATTPGEQQATGFAVVAGQSAAVWGDLQSRPDGTLIEPGPLELKSGIVQLELFSGVTVVVDGAAAFSLMSPMELVVAQGKFRAHVPDPAQGFRIRTTEGEVVDLGTDFAVNVTNGQSELHVIEGEVEWHPVDHDMIRMEQGNAVRWTTDGHGTEIEANAQFVGSADLRAALLSAWHAKRDSWQRFFESYRQDPRLIALYQMGRSDRWERQLANQATGPQATAGEGAIVAARRSTDRWGDPDGACDFSPTGSRVRLVIPGEYRSLTLLCWVKIHSLDRWYNSLFLTDGHDLHEPHWQIMDDGRLFFSVKKRDTWDSSKGEKDKHIYYSPPFWNNSLSGQWLMIATVYDVEARKVVHYLNGLQLSTESIPAEYLVERVTIGNASLCNWGLPERDEPRFAVRNLNGSMDEFGIFNAALSAAEIKELYEHGRP